MAVSPGSAAPPGIEILQQLVDDFEIRRLVDGYDNALDHEDWAACRDCLANAVMYDVTAIHGGEPKLVPADKLVSMWRAARFEGKHYHHMRTNHHVILNGDSATMFSKRYGLIVLSRGTGSDLLEAFTEYLHTLVRTANGWKISGIEATFVYGRGNEMVRDYKPGA